MRARHAACSLPNRASRTPASVSQSGTAVLQGKRRAGANEAMKHAASRELYAYWREKRGSRPQSAERAEDRGPAPFVAYSAMRSSWRSIMPAVIRFALPARAPLRVVRSRDQERVSFLDFLGVFEPPAMERPCPFLAQNAPAQSRG